MTGLISDTPEAGEWARNNLAERKPNEIFGKFEAGVVWSDAKGRNGETLVPVDQIAMVDEINAEGVTLLKGHDPGFPVGRVLSAASFTSPAGISFVVAILGLYQGSNLSGFEDLQLGPIISLEPGQLPALTDAAWIQLDADPREVGEAWIEEITRNAPLRVEHKERSHNAADVVAQLILVGLPYAVLVWNPFIKAIAEEAGKDTYAAMKQWLKRLFAKSSELSNPIVQIASHYGECQVSFIVRGTDMANHEIALDGLSTAARTSSNLVQRMAMAGFPPAKLTYEYREADGVWFPSFAELRSGKLITDNAKLIAVENLPTGLSTGFSASKSM